MERTLLLICKNLGCEFPQPLYSINTPVKPKHTCNLTVVSTLPRLTTLKHTKTHFRNDTSFKMSHPAAETSSFMTDFLRQSGGVAIIDGGLATELERHGADLNDPLWSAKCLLTSPHLVRAVPPLFSLCTHTPMCFCFRWNWCCLCFSFRVSFSLLSADQMVPLDPIIFFVIQIIIKNNLRLNKERKICVKRGICDFRTLWEKWEEGGSNWRFWLWMSDSSLQQRWGSDKIKLNWWRVRTATWALFSYIHLWLGVGLCFWNQLFRFDCCLVLHKRSRCELSLFFF